MLAEKLDASQKMPLIIEPPSGAKTMPTAELIKMRDFFISELHIFGTLLFRGFDIKQSNNLKTSRAASPKRICSITRAASRRAFR
jgi:hypothetical protein